MRNLATPSNLGMRRGSAVGGAASMPLMGPNQARYKGLLSTPGVVKFSQWKRENDIQKWVKITFYKLRYRAL